MAFLHTSAPAESFHDAITRFRDNGLTMKLARSATGGILMPTKSFYASLTNMGFESYEEVEQAVHEHRVQYECLYHRTDTFDAEYGDKTVEDKLEIMENFVRVTPIPVKSWELVFLCDCKDGYRYCACDHSIVLSMLCNPKLNFPHVERAAQLKAKEVKKASTPFDAVNKRKKKQYEEQQEKDDGKVKWDPVFPKYSTPLAQSGAGMAAQSGKIGHSAQQACMLWFCILPSTCYHLKLLCSQECAQEEPSLPRDSVVPSQPVTVADALQRDVDPELLVSSKGKGPTARWQYPTQKNPKARVCVLKILLVLVLGESLLTLCAHLHSVQRPSASQPSPLEFEHAGGKRDRSESPTVATSTRPLRRQCSQPPPGKK
jgi:hypothetical protein